MMGFSFIAQRTNTAKKMDSIVWAEENMGCRSKNLGVGKITVYCQ